MITIPYFSQERPESCVPACLRMALAAFGLERSENDLYICCETYIDGTLPSAVVRCAQRLGFSASAQRLSSIEQFQAILAAQSTIAIAFVNLAPLLGITVIHAIVVESIPPLEEEQLSVLDPAYPPRGHRQWSIDLFKIGWQLARNQVILISRTA